MKTDELKSELFELTNDLLKSDNMVRIKVTGVSMQPMLRSGDVVTVRKCSASSLNPGDIAGFKSSGKWLAHRILKKDKVNGRYILYCKGDSAKNMDQPVAEENLVGKIISFSRNGKVRNLESAYYIRRGRFNARLSKVLTPVFLFSLLINNKWSKGFRIFKEVFKSLFFISRRSIGRVIANIIMAAVQGFLPLVIIYLIRMLVDDITNIGPLTDKTDAFEKLLMLITATGLVFLASSLLTLISNNSRERLSQSISIYIYDLLHQKHIHLDMSCLEDPAAQNKIHRAVQEAGFRPLKMVNEALSIVTSGVSCLLVIVMLFGVHWSVALLILIAVLPGFFVRFRFSASFYQLNRANSSKEREAYYYNRVLTGLPFAKELRLFRIGNLFTTRFNNVQIYLHKQKNSLLRKRLVAEIIAQVFAVGIVFFSFGLVSWFAINGSLTIGTVVLFFLVFQRGFSVMKELFNSVAAICEDNVFLRDFFDFLEMPSSSRPSEPVQFTEELQKGIKIENVCFHYPTSQRMALENISIEIPAGKTVALVGANGSGKTTLVKLLCAFYKPDSGRILFDDSDISESDPKGIRSRITAVFQDFALYNMTAAENIWLGNTTGEINLDEVKKSAMKAGIADVLENLPDGYENMLGNLFDKGEELSIGQWQKMAIARAFYRNSPVLFMDEPSSALDAETELQLLSNLKQLARNKTVLIISHRFSTIKWADMIYVLHEGKIIEGGNHAQLMTLKGKYSSMFELSREL